LTPDADLPLPWRWLRQVLDRSRLFELLWDVRSHWS